MGHHGPSVLHNRHGGFEDNAGICADSHLDGYALRQLLTRFRDDERGVVFLVVGLCLIVLIGFAGLAIDGGYIYWTRTNLQATADSAALAGLAVLPANDGTLSADEQTTVSTEAVNYARKNMPVAKHQEVLVPADVTPGFWDMDGDYGTLTERTFYAIGNLPAGVTELDAVRVTTRRDSQNGNRVSLLFVSVLGITGMDLGATAIAWIGAGGGTEACILSLKEGSEAGVISLPGASTFDLDGCGIAMHSEDEDAMIIGGTNTIDSGAICVPVSEGVGNEGVDESGTVTWIPGPEAPIVNDCDPPDDPLAGLSTPTTTPCGTAPFTSGGNDEATIIDDATAVTLFPGVYCFGIEVNSDNHNVTFSPGVYRIRGGGLKFSGSNGQINGDGVTFFITDEDGDGGAGAYGPGVDFSGSGNTVNLLAPDDTGTYPGVLFYGDRTSPPQGAFLWKFAGTNNTTAMDGVIYMPTQLVEFSGENPFIGPCGVKIISLTVNFNGNSGIFPNAGEICRSDNVGIFFGGGINRLVL